MGGFAFAFPRSAQGIAGYQQTKLSSPPPGNFARKCLFPLPENTSILAVVPWPDGKGNDFYYRQDKQMNAQKGGEQWVCGIAKPTAAGGAALPADPVERINPDEYSARPNIIVRGAEGVLGPLEKAQENVKRVGTLIVVGLAALAVLAVVVAVRK